MVKRFLPLLSLALATTCLGDVNSDIQQCLTESSTQAGSKTACVQKAINNATVGANGQASQLYNAYITFAQSDLGNISSSGSSQGSMPATQPAAVSYPNTAPPAGQRSAPMAPPQAPNAPAPQSGIKYY